MRILLLRGHVFNILSSVYSIISFLFPLVHFFDVGSVREIDTVIQKLYEDNATGKISDERFATMSMSLENEQSGLKDRIPALEDDLENAKVMTEGLQRVVDKAKRVTRLEALNLNWYTSLLRKS